MAIADLVIFPLNNDTSQEIVSHHVYDGIPPDIATRLVDFCKHDTFMYSSLISSEWFEANLPRWSSLPILGVYTDWSW